MKIRFYAIELPGDRQLIAHFNSLDTKRNVETKLVIGNNPLSLAERSVKKITPQN